MRQLDSVEISAVSGGTNAVQAATNVCRSLPASTTVSISISTGGSIGAGSTNTTTGSTITFETTCGALLEAEKKSG